MLPAASRRVAIVFDNFGPYFIARLAGAARLMPVLGVEVNAKSAIYAWDPPDRPARLQHVTLRTADAPPLGWTATLAALDRHVAPFEPEAVAVMGWSTLASLAGVVWAKQRGIPAIVMSESNEFDVVRTGVGERVKRKIVRQFAAGLVGGASARDYLVALGVPAERIFLGFDAVDNDFFTRCSEAFGASSSMPEVAPGKPLSPSLRKRYFLAVARFVPKKNLERLLAAFADYWRAAKMTPPWPLVIVGDGPLRSALLAQRAALGLADAVHFPGFQQYDRLPNYYATAGVFVHASTTEQWGLVVNEAMASGLPVAVSNRCGCAETLVAEGENGFTFDPNDQSAITTALQTLAEHPDRAGLGAASRRRIADWGPARFASGMHSAVEAAITSGPPRMLPGVRTLLRAVAELQHRRPTAGGEMTR